jgi:prepilin-type N-terminal cleavage/methylation domain-containing protein
VSPDGRRERRARVSEQGFTLVEVLVAALLLTFVVAAGSSLFVSGSDASISAQRQSQLISVADQQIETIRQEVKTQGFDELAMSAAPATGSSVTLSYDSSTHTDPNYFASASTGCGASNEGYAIETNYDSTTEGPASGVEPWSGCTDTSSTVTEPLEILSAGFVTPQQTNISVGTDTATVDTYVTDTYVGCNSALGGCPSTSGGDVSGCSWPTSTSTSTACADARRVIVAVFYDDAGTFSNNGRSLLGTNAPVYISTVFTNPTPSNSPESAAGVTLGAQLG